jgi:hypothetical protein
MTHKCHKKENNQSSLPSVDEVLDIVGHKLELNAWYMALYFM